MHRVKAENRCEILHIHQLFSHLKQRFTEMTPLSVFNVHTCRWGTLDNPSHNSHEYILGHRKVNIFTQNPI